MVDSLNVLLGVTGGIAAFKAPLLVRRLRERGHRVRCALTESASAFVTPLTLEVLTGEPVYGEEYLRASGSGEELHLTAATWADVFCVAPLTANTLARLALGLADDFLTTTNLMYEGPLVLAPAMHSAMWNKGTVTEHVALLQERGAYFVGPDDGPLASGESGVGRLSEIEEIVERIEAAARTRSSEPSSFWSGRAVVVSAGPTEEPIDDVRYLSNRSSGRMGFSIAAEAARRGAAVTLVAGPVALETPVDVSRVDVRTAAEMKEVIESAGASADLIVMAAAVADFRPAERAPGKLKKAGGLSEVRLERTADILGGLRALAPNAVLVGFAAESGDPRAEALRKLEAKKLDWIVANDISRADIGFQSSDNEVTLYRRGGESIALSRRPKSEIARALLDTFERGVEPHGPEAVASDR